MKTRKLRVGLVAAYSGTNLGDQAIQSACIANLQARRPEIRITGIYLNTWRPRHLHDIETFPIMGMAIPFFSHEHELFDADLSEEATASQGGVQSKIVMEGALRGWLKQFPSVKWAVQKARMIVSACRNVVRECLWMWRSWRLVRGMDLVLVAGSGQIDEEWGGAWGQPYALFRWALVCRLSGRKFAIASVGASLIESRLSRAFFAFALRHVDYLSCRDPDSVTRVKGLLLNSEPLMIPDLALTLPALQQMRESQINIPTAVAISPIAYGRAGSWPDGTRAAYGDYIENLSDVVAKLLNSGWKIMLFTTSGSDRRAVDDVLAVLNRDMPESSASVSVIHPKTLSQLSESLSDYSYVIASRLHGVILSHLLEKPVLAISFDPKVDAHVRQFRQAEFCVAMSGVRSSDICTLFERLVEATPEVRRNLREVREQLAPSVHAQYDSLIKLAESGVE